MPLISVVNIEGSQLHKLGIQDSLKVREFAKSKGTKIYSDSMKITSAGSIYFVDNSFPKQNMTCYNDFRNCNWIPTIAYNNSSPFRN
jgi:hypothetical protein